MPFVHYEESILYIFQVRNIPAEGKIKRLEKVERECGRKLGFGITTDIQLEQDEGTGI